MIIADLVKDRVSVPMLLDRYGVKVGRGGRCACPVHHGKDQNMVVKPRWYRCFRCGSSGTVIDLQMALAGEDFNNAVNAIDAMFGLGLRPTKPSEQIASRLALAQHKAAKKRAEARKSDNDHQYTLLCYLRRYCDERGIDCGRLDEILDYYMTNDGDEAMPDAFKLAADAGLAEQMEVMMIGALDAVHNDG